MFPGDTFPAATVVELYAEDGGTTSPQACVDEVADCPTHKRNGGCLSANPHYVMWRKQCAKTCGYCSTSAFQLFGASLAGAKCWKGTKRCTGSSAPLKKPSGGKGPSLPLFLITCGTASYVGHDHYGQSQTPINTPNPCCCGNQHTRPMLVRRMARGGGNMGLRACVATRAGGVRAETQKQGEISQPHHTVFRGILLLLLVAMLP